MNGKGTRTLAIGALMLAASSAQGAEQIGRATAVVIEPAVGGETRLVDTGEVSTSGSQSEDATLLSLDQPLVSAAGLQAIVDLGGSSAAAEAGSAGIVVRLPDGPVIEARGVRAEARNSCAGTAQALTEIGFLEIDGEVIVGEELRPNPDTRADVGEASVILNEQFFDPVSGRVTVNAIRVSVRNGSDLVLSSASAGVSACVP